MCFQIEIFHILVKAFSSVMTECGLHCKREFWHHRSKRLQREVNRAWDNQTWCQWRNKDSLGKETLLTDTDLLITILNMKLQAQTWDGQSTWLPVHAQTGEGLTKQRRYEQFHFLILLCVLLLHCHLHVTVFSGKLADWADFFPLHLWRVFSALS